MTAPGDYTKQIHIGATPEKVFDTLTSAAEFASWWAPATGSAAEAGELSITFDGIEDPLVVQHQSDRPLAGAAASAARPKARLNQKIPRQFQTPTSAPSMTGPNTVGHATRSSGRGSGRYRLLSSNLEIWRQDKPVA